MSIWIWSQRYHIKNTIEKNEKYMIPKIIHYCWYGRGEMSDQIKQTIASWEKQCPDYEIKKWTEDNSPMQIPYLRDAVKHHKWAFAADYMRFYVLYREGAYIWIRICS